MQKVYTQSELDLLCLDMESSIKAIYDGCMNCKEEEPDKCDCSAILGCDCEKCKAPYSYNVDAECKNEKIKKAALFLKEHCENTDCNVCRYGLILQCDVSGISEYYTPDRWEIDRLYKIF